MIHSRQLSANGESMSRTVIVTRHASIVTWLAVRGITGEVIDSIDAQKIDALSPGDRVIGPLPPGLVAELVNRGIVYEAIDMELGIAERRRELSVEEMDEAHARLARYVVRRVDPPNPAAELELPKRETVRHRTSNDFGPIPRAFIVLLLVTAGVVSQSWIFQSLWDALQPAIQDTASNSLWHRLTQAIGSEKGRALLVQGLIAFAFFVTVSTIAYALRGQILHAAFDVKRVDRRRILITGLSFPPKNRALLDLALTVPLPLLGASENQIKALEDKLEAETAGSGESEQWAALRAHVAAVKSLQSGFSWQQPIRAVCAHLPALESVLVLVSEETAKHFELFESFLRGRLDAEGYSHVAIVRLGTELNIEDHDQILASFRSAIDYACTRWRAREKDITIDCTPVSKIYSIAAAIATINRGITVTYVNNGGRVSTYDGSISLMDSRT